MHVYGCEDTIGVTFTCSAWQPDWWQEGAISDGYPRFGTKDITIKAGIIDVSSEKQATFNPVLLKDAVNLAVGCVTMLAAVFF